MSNTTVEAPPRASSRRALLIVQEGETRSITLPTSGSLRVGRAAEAEIVVDDPRVSRQHAIIEVGESYRVQDLDSANGSWIAGRKLAPNRWTEFLPGEALDVGGALIVLQVPAARPGTIKLSTAAYLEERLAEECRRQSAGPKSPFAVVAVQLGGDPSAEQLQRCFAQVMRAGDVLASYAPGAFQLVLLDTARSRATALCDQLERAFVREGATATTGLALFPDAGLGADALIEAALAALRSSAPTPDRPVIADPVMIDLYRIIDRVAKGSISVLLLGPTGSGKEVISTAVHQRSPRANKPLLRLNCAALSDSLVESELFGYEKGAFTGAERAKPGLLEAAEGGTVFLDEVGELAPSIQAKLLRALEQHEVLRVGATAPRAIDVRFVSATNRDLEAAVADGKFRADLYYRLAGVTLTVPPLASRTGEIEPLVRLFLARLSKDLELGDEPRIDDEVLELLRAYSWPGNIRELKNVVERALLLAAGEEIRAEHLPLEKLRATWQASTRPSAAPRPATDDKEREHILAVLEACAGNQTRAAAELGMARQTLAHKLDLYGVARPRKRR